ncbi:bacillithiol system redox-active protein YtxJ [Halocola ammonii]
MNWHFIQDTEDLQNAMDLSYQQPVMIFKHSTRCPVSFMAKRKVESSWSFDDDAVIPFFLDLISFRQLSQEIATTLKVEHQSPQIILLKDGQASFHASHHSIDTDDLKPFLQAS